MDSEEQCVEGKTKKQKCNTCVCVDGAFFCSRKKCDLGKPGVSEQVEQQQHEHMMEKVGPTVTKKGWGTRKKPISLSDCSSGMTKSIDCNQCICAVGKWACTKRSCIALTLREKASYTDGSVIKQVDTLVENPDMDGEMNSCNTNVSSNTPTLNSSQHEMISVSEDCSEGNTRQLDCNQCVCHYNSWSCTHLTCAPTPPPPKPHEIEGIELIYSSTFYRSNFKDIYCSNYFLSLSRGLPTGR